MAQGFEVHKPCSVLGETSQLHSRLHWLPVNFSVLEARIWHIWTRQIRVLDFSSCRAQHSLELAPNLKMNKQVCPQCGTPADIGVIVCEKCGAFLRPPLPLIQSFDPPETISSMRLTVLKMVKRMSGQNPTETKP